MKTTSICAFIVSVIALIFGVYVLSEQRKLSTTTTETVYTDSIVKCVQNTINPLFNTVDEVLSFRSKTLEGLAIEDEFNNMPEQVLKTVASVIIKREGHASRRSIVYEYKANKQVYDNLPTDSDKKNGSSGGEPVRSVDSTASNNLHLEVVSKDTVINGEPYTLVKKK